MADRFDRLLDFFLDIDLFFDELIDIFDDFLDDCNFFFVVDKESLDVAPSIIKVDVGISRSFELTDDYARIFLKIMKLIIQNNIGTHQGSFQLVWKSA